MNQFFCHPGLNVEAKISEKLNYCNTWAFTGFFSGGGNIFLKGEGLRHYMDPMKAIWKTIRNSSTDSTTPTNTHKHTTTKDTKPDSKILLPKQTLQHPNRLHNTPKDSKRLQQTP